MQALHTQSEAQGFVVVPRYTLNPLFQYGIHIGAEQALEDRKIPQHAIFIPLQNVYL